MLGVIVASAGLARAHSYSVAYLEVEIAPDARGADVRLRVNAMDLAEVLGLPADSAATPDDIAARGDRLIRYGLEHIELRSGAQPCAAGDAAVRAVRETEWFAELRWRASCPEPLGELVVDYDVFFELDPNHTGLLTVIAPDGERATAPLTNGAARFVWELGAPPPSGLGAFFVEGLRHIAFGYDHVAFLLALLLAAAVTGSRREGYVPRGVSRGLRYTGAIVTSFTVAHSLTLIAAALGWVRLPGALVESVIALSIVYVAVENLIRPQAKRRWLVTFAFGLVHGLGFASSLEKLLPPEAVIGPLLSFNVGVEAGQLVIAAVCFPVLHVIAARAGADTYRRVVVLPVSVALAVFGAVWFVQRVQ